MSDESGKESKEEEEEYVLMDLDDVARHIDIPSDAPYTLSVTYSHFSSLLLSFFCLGDLYHI